MLRHCRFLDKISCKWSGASLSTRRSSSGGRHLQVSRLFGSSGGSARSWSIGFKCKRPIRILVYDSLINHPVLPGISDLQVGCWLIEISSSDQVFMYEQYDW